VRLVLNRPYEYEVSPDARKVTFQARFDTSNYAPMIHHITPLDLPILLNAEDGVQAGLVAPAPPGSKKPGESIASGGYFLLKKTYVLNGMAINVKFELKNQSRASAPIYLVHQSRPGFPGQERIVLRRGEQWVSLTEQQAKQTRFIGPDAVHDAFGVVDPQTDTGLVFRFPPSALREAKVIGNRVLRLEFKTFEVPPGATLTLNLRYELASNVRQFLGG